MTHANVPKSHKVKKRTQTVIQMIHYVDRDERPVHDDYTAVLNFTQSSVWDEETGKEIWTDGWIPETTATFVAVIHPEVKNHHLVEPEVTKIGAYNVEVNDETFKNPLLKIHKVVYDHDIESIKRTQVVMQTIHYKYDDGRTAYRDHTVSLLFTQSGVRDLTNGREIWDSNWTLTQHFEVVPSPVIDGHTADQERVGSYVITVNDKNFIEKQDKEETVVYSKDSVLDEDDEMDISNAGEGMLPQVGEKDSIFTDLVSMVQTFFGLTNNKENLK